MRLKTISVVSSLAIMACMTAPAYAQDEGASEGARNADIIVTAEFREANIQDTPIAITAVNAEMLEARGQTSIKDVAAQAPNVSLRPQPQNGGSGLIAFIRGVGQTDFNYALDPGVGVYIDDVYIPTLSSSLLDLVDLDRVEILRGPQGTLAGKNAIGGAIKLFTQKPKGDGSGSLRVEYGSYNQLVVRGMMDFKITDNLAMRVSGMGRGSDGYVAQLDYGQTHPTSNVPTNNARGGSNSDYSTEGGQNVLAGRAALRWTPTDRLEVNVTADFTRERSEAIPVVLIAAGAIAPAGTTFDPYSVGNSSSLDGLGLHPGPVYDNPWLRGKDGKAVNVSCAFVPAGPYSCDTGGNLKGYDPRFVSYSNFIDAMDPTPQAPFKPYFALPITQFQGWGVGGNITYDLSDDIQLTYIGSYRKYWSKFGQDQDGTPIAVAQLDNQLDHHAFSSEVRLSFKAADGLIDGTVGAFYLKQRGTYDARVDLNYVQPATIDFINGPDPTDSSTKAIFGTLTLHPTDMMSITGGLRYTEDEKTFTFHRPNPDGSIPPDGTPAHPGVCNLFAAPNCLIAGLDGVVSEFKGNRIDWRIVGDYRFSDQFLVYASASTGFKGGGVNPRPFVPDQALPFNPETITTYETGFKADLLDRRVRLNGAAFYNKYNDIILGKIVCPESVLATPCLRPDNIGAADVWGLELEASVYPTEGLSFQGSISYLHFKYTTPSYNGFLIGAFNPDGTPILNTNTPDPNDPVISGIPVDGITPYTPTLNYSIAGQYDYETKAGTFSVRLDGSYQGTLYTTAENTFWSKIPGRFLADGHISWESKDDDWKVTLEVKNIFDKYYFTSVSDASSSLGIVSGVPGLPRTWSVAVQRKF